MRFFTLLSLFLLTITKLSAITLSAGSESGTSGSQVVIPITVKDFNDIISLQGTIQWDATVATYSSLEQFGLTGLSSSNFGTSQTSSGKLTFSWYESNLSGVTLSDNTVIFAIKFTLSGSAGSQSNVSFSNSPTTIEVIDENFNAVTVTTSTGTISIATTTDPCTSDPVSISVSSSDATCGSNNGSASASVSGGTSPYTYSWSNGKTTSSISGLAAGSYSVTVTDDNGCTATETITVNSSNGPTVTVSGTDATCGNNNGSALASVSGGTSPYTYSWSNGKTTSSISGLAAGSYSVTVTDDNGCTTTETVTISSSTAPTLSISSTDETNGQGDGTASVSVSGGTSPYSYSWSNGKTTSSISGLSAGTYTVTVTDDNGCTATTSVTISNTTTTTTSDTLALVLGTASGSSGTQVTVPVKVANFTDVVSMQGTIQWDVNVATYSSTQQYGLSGLSSSNFGTSLTSSGKLTFSWNDANLTGQTLTDSTTVFSITFTLIGNSGDQTSLDFKNSPTALEFIDENFNTLPYNTYSGNLTITGTTSDPCTTNPPSVDLGGDVVLCSGSSTTLSAGMGFSSYSWSNGSTSSSISVSTSGTYYVTVTDFNGCSASDTVLVSMSSSANGCSDLFFSEYVEGSSNNKAVEIYNPTSSSIDLSNYTIELYNNGTTSVSAIITLSGSIASKDVYVMVYSSASSSLKAYADVTHGYLAFNGNDAIVLKNNGTIIDQIGVIGESSVWTVGTGSTENYTLVRESSVTGGQTDWTIGATEWDVYSQDTYSYLGSHSSSCANSNTSTASAGADVSICKGENTTLSASGGSSYQWNSSSSLSSTTVANPTASPTTTTTYIVKITDNNGCVTTDSVTVTVNNVATLATSYVDEINGQADGTATVTATGGTSPYSYLWSNGQTTSSISGLAAGTYTVSVTDANGCTTTASVTISNTTTSDPCTTNPPSVDLGGDVVLCSGNSTTLSAGSGFSYYSWSNGSTSSSISVSTSGTYYVTVTDANGCTAGDTVMVSVSSSVNGCNELFISEYVEGSSNNKAVEIYNPTSTTIDLSFYQLVQYSNGNTTSSSTISLSGNIASKDVFVVTHSSASTTLKSLADQTSGSLSFNGNDVVALTKNGTTIDQVGVIGESSAWTVGTGSTENYTLVRESSVTEGQTDWSVGATEWDVYAIDTYSYLGSHTSSCLNVTTPYGGSDQTICKGETTTLGAGGGVSYQWDASNTLSSLTVANPTASPTKTTTYVIHITDGYGCIATDSVTVTVNDAPSLSINETDATCGQNNGEASVTATSGTSPYTYLWSNSETTAAISGLAIGTYTVTVTDANSCISTATATISNANGPSISISSTNESCGNANGTVSATVSGGTSPYSYLWDNGKTTSSLTGLSSGTYVLIVTDANGCTATETATLTNTAGPTASVTATNATCGNNNGTAKVTVSGGTSPYTYLWSNGKTTSSISGLSGGSYTVTVTDANGCTTTASATVSSTNGPSVSATASDASCGSSNGSATASVSGGTSPYTYSWSNGKTSASITGLSAGSYTITVTDANGCTGTATATVSSTSAPTISISTTKASCGQSNGTATATVSGGTSPYSYSWSNGKTTSSITGLAAGSYTLTVTDANGCTSSSTASISNTNGPSVTLSASNATCGQNNGSATTTVTGGTSPYTYLWSNGASTSSVTGLAAGNYTVKVTDANGCSTTESVTISSSTGPSVTVTGTDATCGEKNGKAKATVSGGTSPYTYSWSNGKTNATISNLAAGSYTVTVTDANGCTASGSVTINSTSAASVSVSTTDASCGQSNGSASATASGGTSPYSYSWSNGSTSSSVSNLAAGSYTLTVSDANGCSTTKTVNINNSNGPSVTLKVTDEECSLANGKITSTVSGGTSPYTYLWSNGQTTQNATALTAGSYTLIVTDANGCITTASATVNDKAAPSLTLSSTNAVNGQANGTATVVASGGTGNYTYSWNSSPTQTTSTATGLTPGTYTVTVSDSNCTIMDSVVVGDTTTTDPCLLNPISIDLGNDITLCKGDSVKLDAGAGFVSYLWISGDTSQSITAVSAGAYAVTVTDQNGCKATDEIHVSYSGSSVDLGGDIVLCQNATTILSAGNGYLSYTWSSGEITSSIQVDSVGTYHVTVTDTNGCTSSDTIVVSVNNNTTSGCNELYISEYVEGSSNNKFIEVYNPTSGSIDLSLYSIIIYSNGSTTASSTIGLKGMLVGQDVFVLAHTSADTNVFSDMTSGSLSFNGNDVVVLTNNGIMIDKIGEIGQSTAWPVGSGNTENYSLVRSFTITAGQTDWTIGATEWDVYPMDTFSYLGFHNSICSQYQKPDAGNDVVICSGESVQLQATGGKMYEWYTSSSLDDTHIANPFATPAATTTYYVDIVDANGCLYTDSVSVIVNPSDTMSLGADVVVCQPSYTLDAGSGYNSYLWSNGSTQQTLTVTSSGVYAVSITNSYGCVTSDEIKVGLSSGDALKLGNDTSICNTDPITLDAGLNFTSYSWSTGDSTQTILVSQSGSYKVTVVDSNGCSNTDEIIVTLGGGVNIGNNVILCNGNSATLDAGAGYTSYEWTTGDTTQSITVTSAGNYGITTMDKDGCVSSDTVEVSVDTELSVSLTNDTAVCQGGVVLVDAGSFASYSWSTGDSTQTLEIKTAGVYTIEVLKFNGCTSIDSIIVEEHPIVPVNLGPSQYICKGETVQLDAGLGYNNYLWSNGDTGSSTSVNAGGYYYVVVTDSNGCTTSGGVEVSQYAMPAVMLGADTVLCPGDEIKLNAGSGYVSYQWSTGATSQTITITTIGAYYVTVEDTNGCMSIDTVNVSNCQSGINEVNAYINVTLYPNPVQEQLNVSVSSGNSSLDKIEVYNAIGELIYVTSNNNVSKVTLDFTNMAEGIYTLRIFSGNYILSRKVTKVY